VKNRYYIVKGWC